jgi:hypothetical protein
MRKKIFATGELAKELQKEATAIWRMGSNEDNFEGLENDPVVSLLMTALAYQEYTADNELSRLKDEVLEDFSRMLIPYELCHAKPASVLVQTNTEENVNMVSLHADTTFSLSDSKYNFMPLLETTVYNAKVDSIVRLDARRWKVSIDFKEEISSLEGFSFLVNNNSFKDLNISIAGKKISLVKPWHYANLPLSACFSIDSMLYNETLAFDATTTWFDLFAEQNKRMFVVEKYASDNIFACPVDKIDLVFEFMGMSDDFVFDKSQLIINTVLLVNTSERSATISVNNPIVRIADEDENASEKLLHLMRPSAEQMYKNISFTLRRSAIERFNSDNLLKLLHCLIDKYSTDYYAFMQIDRYKNGLEVSRLYQWLVNLAKYLEESPIEMSSGVYLLLKKGKENIAEDESLTLNYLTTQGAAVNQYLSVRSVFNVPVGLSGQDTIVVAEPVLGVDEAVGTNIQNSMLRYYMVTNNRLVTPADIKIFCYNELLRRYNIDSSIIRNIIVKNVIYSEIGHCGFETKVEILMIDDVFVKRSLAGKINEVELILQKMIEVRSSFVYPVQVNIRIV